MVETPRGNLVAGMKWFLGACTGPFHRKIPAPVNSLPWTAIVQPPLLNSMARSGVVVVECQKWPEPAAFLNFIGRTVLASGFGWSYVTGTAANRCCVLDIK